MGETKTGTVWVVEPGFAFSDLGGAGDIALADEQRRDEDREDG